MVSEQARIKIIRSLLNIESRELAKRVGVLPGSVTGWETGKTSPQGKNRIAIAKLCQENEIAFLPSGMPIPFEDLVLFQNYRGVL